jgi:hypothetical protein
MDLNAVSATVSLDFIAVLRAVITESCKLIRMNFNLGTNIIKTKPLSLKIKKNLKIEIIFQVLKFNNTKR